MLRARNGRAVGQPAQDARKWRRSLIATVVIGATYGFHAPVCNTGAPPTDPVGPVCVNSKETTGSWCVPLEPGMPTNQQNGGQYSASNAGAFFLT